MTENSEEILRLCTKGDLARLRELLGNLSAEQIETIRDNHKASCLHYAARAGSINVLEYLVLEKNLSAHLVSEIGATCLHDAGVKGDLSVIEWIVKNTTLNLLSKDSDGATIAHLASKFNHLSILEWLYDVEGVSSLKQQTYNGATCMHFAVASNSFECLKKLVELVPSLVNIQMSNGVTPIYLAVQENSINLTKFLLYHGANFYIKASDGMCTVHVACQNGNLEMIKILYERYNINLNIKDYNGATTLHYASNFGDCKLVAYLLSNGAQIVQDKFGNTPLHDAAIGGNIECARYLVGSNCDPSLRDHEGKTAADIAESLGHVSFAEEIRRLENLYAYKNEMHMQQELNHQNESLDDEMLQTKMRSESRFRNRAQSDFGLNYRTSAAAFHETRKYASENNQTNLNKLSENVDESSSTEMSEEKQINVISPIFNTNQVVSTSTPSNHLDDEEDYVEDQVQATPEAKTSSEPIAVHTDENKTEEAEQKEVEDNNNNNNNDEAKLNILQINTNDVEDNYSNINYSEERITKNQGIVKIVQGEQLGMKVKRQRSIYSNETKISAIEELDRCIAEFDNFTSDDASSLDKRPVFSSGSSSSTHTANAVFTPQRISVSSNTNLLPHDYNNNNNNNKSETSILTNEKLRRYEYEEISSKEVQNAYHKLNTYKSEIQIISSGAVISTSQQVDPNNNNTTSFGIKNDKENHAPNVAKYSTIIPPPPPPLPSSWFSLKQSSPLTKQYILSSKESRTKLSEVVSKTLTNNKSFSASNLGNSIGKRESVTPSNVIDELEMQIRRGTLYKNRNAVDRKSVV